MIRIHRVIRDPSHIQALQARFVQAQNWRASQTHLGSQRLQEVLTADYLQLLELAQETVYSARARYFNLPKIEAQAYAECLIEWENEKSEFFLTWAGIRFRNLDSRFPFVAVSSSIDARALLPVIDRLGQLLWEEFSCFQPEGFTLHLSPDADDSESMLWNVFWVGKAHTAAQLKLSSSSKIAPEIQLTQPEQPMNYERYAAQYQFWGMLNSELAKWVNPLSESERERAIEQGLYFELRRHEEILGVIAGEFDAFWGCEGVYMLDNFIFPAFQGCGLGTAMFQKFAQQIQNEWIWGTIYGANQAACKVADAVGRQPFEVERYFPFYAKLKVR